MLKRLAASMFAMTVLVPLVGFSPLAPEAHAKKGGSRKVYTGKAAPSKDAAVIKMPGFIKACQLYKQNKYLEAIKELEQIDTHGGCCQWTHYYLGLCYQGLNQVGMSYRQYSWVLSYGRDPNLRRYSQYAQETLSYYAANRTYGGQGGIAAAVAQSCATSGGGFG